MFDLLSSENLRSIFCVLTFVSSFHFLCFNKFFRSIFCVFGCVLCVFSVSIVVYINIVFLQVSCFMSGLSVSYRGINNIEFYNFININRASAMSAKHSCLQIASVSIIVYQCDLS